MWARIHLIPVLQAEADRDLVRRHWADLAREKELMGKETSAYNGERYVHVLGTEVDSMYGLNTSADVECRFVRPTFAISPQHITK